MGRPLDPASAARRAFQIAALADPSRLRILSAAAAADPSDRATQNLVDDLLIDSDEFDAHVSELVRVGLVTRDLRGSLQLTADAWVRFGRLLAGSAWDPVAQPSPPAAVPSDLPPVISRISADLAYRFSAYFSSETVAKYVAESYWMLAERAKIDRHLASLTTRFATDRLSALAETQGLILRGVPEVLFVCVQNAGRSQMAAAILRHLAGERVHVRTAGSSPSPRVNPVVVQALDEIGVPLASEFPKPLTDEVVQAADFVITMGCGDACPIYPGRRYLDWAIDDPVGLSIEGVRVIRDDIFARVRTLVEEMSPLG